MMRHWTLFLDRDGVINERLPGDYVSKWEDFHFCTGVLPALSFFSTYFSRILIVTNQQGIGKGLMTESDLEQIHQNMLDAIQTAGGRIDQVYFSPDLATSPTPTRKPTSAMGLRAREEFPDINFEEALMVGDSKSDIEFGKNLGMQTALIHGKEDEAAFWETSAMQPDHRFHSLKELADWLQNLTKTPPQ